MGSLEGPFFLFVFFTLREFFICVELVPKLRLMHSIMKTKGHLSMKQLTSGILMGLFAAMSSSYAESQRYHPNHLFVKMKAGESLVNSPLIKSSKKLFGNLYLVNTSSADKLAASISSSADIEYVEKDFYAPAKMMPKHEVIDHSDLFIKSLQNFNFNATSFNDPYLPKLWAFDQKKGLDVIGAYDSLPPRELKQVIVAVVDTGVDHTHEDLRDVMWTNEKEIPANGVDDDNNGHIDDIHGINTLVRDANRNPTMNTMASHWHGTHVAGTIAATQNNGLGIAGVASNVKIMAIRTVPDDKDELDSDIVDAFLYASKMGAKIINCSFGKSVNERGMVVRDTMNEISQNNVLVVIAAGNESDGPLNLFDIDQEPKYPASFDSENALVVASTEPSGGLSEFSNIGKISVDVAAPGTAIWSTTSVNKYAPASGTSMATPNAAGIAAMVMGYYPHLTNTDVKKILMDSVTKLPELADKVVSGGRLNLKAALAEAEAQTIRIKGE